MKRTNGRMRSNSTGAQRLDLAPWGRDVGNTPGVCGVAQIFFQREAPFPFPAFKNVFLLASVVTFVATQFGVERLPISITTGQGRTIKDHRAEIRKPSTSGNQHGRMRSS